MGPVRPLGPLYLHKAMSTYKKCLYRFVVVYYFKRIDCFCHLFWWFQQRGPEYDRSPDSIVYQPWIMTFWMYGFWQCDWITYKMLYLSWLRPYDDRLLAIAFVGICLDSLSLSCSLSLSPSVSHSVSLSSFFLSLSFLSSPPLTSLPYAPADCSSEACVGVIVRDSAGIWQTRRLESSPTLIPIQRSGALWGWEVSLSRALNGSTKLITSLSEFLKGASSNAGARGTRQRSDRTGQGRDHTKNSYKLSREAVGDLVGKVNELEEKKTLEVFRGASCRDWKKR